MAKIRKAAKQAVSRAKAAGARARRQGGQMATRLVRKTVKKAEKTVARVRGQAVAAATKVAERSPDAPGSGRGPRSWRLLSAPPLLQ